MTMDWYEYKKHEEEMKENSWTGLLWFLTAFLVFLVSAPFLGAVVMGWVLN